MRVFSLGELAVFHALEEVEVFLDRAVAPRASRGGVRIAAVFAELLGTQLADVGKTLFNEGDRKLVGLFKVIGAVEEAVAPREAEPLDVLLDSVDVLGVLLRGVCVVHTEICDSAEALGGAEVYAQRLAVTYMQIAVRLGRKARVNGLALEPPPGTDVLGYESLYKVFWFKSHKAQLLCDNQVILS